MNGGPEELERAPEAQHPGAAAGIRLALVMAAAAAGWVRGEAIPPGVTVKEIEFRNLTATSPQALKGVLRTKEGSPFSPEILAEDEKELLRRGFIPRQVEWEPVEGGIKLVFVMTEYPRLASMSIEGFRKYRRGIIEASGLAVGLGASKYHLTLAEKKIEAFLREKGYALAKVNAKSRLSAEGSLIVTFDVEPGFRFLVKKIAFEGNEALDDSKLKKLMRTTVYKWWSGRVYDEAVFREDITRLRGFYVYKGYANAEITSEVKRVGPRGQTHIVINIVEGATYAVSNVTFEGNQTLHDRELLAHIKLQPGAMYSPEALGQDLEALERLYMTGGRGRAHVVVDAAVPRFALDERTVDLHFVVDEGPMVYIRRIRTKGNYKTRQKVILRESDIRPGDVYDADAIDEFRRRLINLQLFRSDRERTIEIDEIDVPPWEGDERRWTDLMVDVEETETGGVGLTGGIGAASGFYAGVFYRQRNFDITDTPDFEQDGWLALYPGRSFVGAGQRLNLRATPGQRLNQYVLSFDEPYLFDKPLHLRTTLARVEWEYDLYDEDRWGGSVYLGKRLSRDVEAGVTLRLENIDISNIDNGSPTDLYDVRGGNTISGLKASIVVDKLDFPWMPSSGYEAFASAEATGGLLGGDYDVFKAELGGRKYYPLGVDERGRKHTLAVRARLGAAWDYGSDGVPVFERFHAGGGGTYGLRGFSFHGVGPVGRWTYVDPYDPTQGLAPATRRDPIGGRFVALGGVEYQFPLLGENLRGVTFIDAGTVTRRISLSGLSDLRVGAGFGFRIFIPAAIFQGVPITLDFGFPILKESDDDTETVHFTLGVAF